MAKFAIVLCFLFVASGVQGSIIDDILQAMINPLQSYITKITTMTSELNNDVSNLETRLQRNINDFNTSIEASRKQVNAVGETLLNRYPEKSTIANTMKEIDTLAATKVNETSTCMTKIVEDLKTNTTSILKEVQAVSTNATRALSGLEVCAEYNDDFSTMWCSMKYVVSRRYDYVGDATTLLTNVDNLHEIMETAIDRMDNDCNLSTESSDYITQALQAISVMRKM